MSELDELREDIRDMPAEALRRMVVTYHMAYTRAYECWAFQRWAVIAQFALWCVWLS